MQFKNIPGLTDIKHTLITSIVRNHVAHSQLFYGKEGSANLALAWAYATYINCENKSDKDSCGKCPACHKMAKVIHPDFHQIFPAIKLKKAKKDEADDKKENTGDLLPLWRSFLIEKPYNNLSQWHEHIGADKNQQAIIPVDEARKTIQKVSLKSFEGEYKILLIWLPELMNVPTANAMLKLLEEPPPKTLFLLVTNNANKLLATILSRALMIKIPSFNDGEIINYLVENNLSTSSASEKIAYLADGNLGEAIALTGNEQNDIHLMFVEWIRFCFKMDMQNLVKMADNFDGMQKSMQKQLFDYSLRLFRDILLYINGGKALVRLANEELTFVENISKVANGNNIEFITNEISLAYYHLERNARAKIIFLNLSLNIVKGIKKL